MIHCLFHRCSLLVRQGPLGSSINSLSSPYRGIALAVMPALWPTSQWISTASAQIAVKMHRIAKLLFSDAHRTAQIARVHNLGCKSTSHRRLTLRLLANLATGRHQVTSEWLLGSLPFFEGSGVGGPRGTAGHNERVKAWGTPCRALIVPISPV